MLTHPYIPPCAGQCKGLINRTGAVARQDGGCGWTVRGLCLDSTWAVSYLEQPDGLCKMPVLLDVDFHMKFDWDIHPGRTHGATRLGWVVKKAD